MGDTNYIGGIVKVLETPKHKILNDNISLTEFRVQFPQFRGNRILHLVFWGKLASEVANYYQTNDYILIEGYVSTINQKPFKKVQVTVLKVFTFVLN
jgi:single-stranded DNA-binding protein